MSEKLRECPCGRGRMDTKQCTKCGEMLPLDEFGPDRLNRDGKRSECRKCDREKARKYYWSHKEEKRAYNNQYHQDHRIELIAQAKHRIESDADKAKAKWVFKDAIRREKLIRPDECSKCGKPCKPDGHHADYTKPLKVVWLCRSCHHYEHRGIDKALTPPATGTEEK